MLAEYFPVLLFILVGLGVGVAPMVLGKLLAPNKPDPEKLSPYECGFEAFETRALKFDVRYYLVASCSSCSTSRSRFFPVGDCDQRHRPGGIPVDDAVPRDSHRRFVYEWMKGALEWNRGHPREGIRHDHRRQAHQLDAYRIAVADDLRLACCAVEMMHAGAARYDSTASASSSGRARASPTS